MHIFVKRETGHLEVNEAFISKIVICKKCVHTKIQSYTHSWNPFTKIESYLRKMYDKSPYKINLKSNWKFG